MQKMVEINRIFFDEETGQDEKVSKKVYLNEKNGERIIRFPVDVYDTDTKEDLHSEIYEIPASHIHKAFELTMDKLKEMVDKDGVGSYEVEAYFEDVSVSVATFLGECYLLQITCDMLGDEGEAIIELTLEKNDMYFSREDFGIELMKEVAPEKLEEWVTLIKENKI